LHGRLVEAVYGSATHSCFSTCIGIVNRPSYKRFYSVITFYAGINAVDISCHICRAEPRSPSNHIPITYHSRVPRAYACQTQKRYNTPAPLSQLLNAYLVPEADNSRAAIWLWGMLTVSDLLDIADSSNSGFIPLGTLAYAMVQSRALYAIRQTST
jgi:hypothetical protein